MACGVPCVVTDVGEGARLVGNTGLIVPLKDPDAMANAWQSLLKMSVTQRQSLGELARERVIRDFSLDTIVNQYESLYTEFQTKIVNGSYINEAH